MCGRYYVDEWIRRLVEESAARRIMERKSTGLEKNQEYEQQRLPFLQ